LCGGNLATAWRREARITERALSVRQSSGHPVGRGHPRVGRQEFATLFNLNVEDHQGLSSYSRLACPKRLWAEMRRGPVKCSLGCREPRSHASISGWSSQAVLATAGLESEEVETVVSCRCSADTAQCPHFYRGGAIAEVCLGSEWMLAASQCLTDRAMDRGSMASPRFG
jgi:hypothetical protein